jgi:hypothetical protein
MFLVNTVQADAIRRAYEAGGDSEALAEFRFRFQGLLGDEMALLCARTIAAWKPFGPGRVGRYCGARLARQSELDRQRAARRRAETTAAEPGALAQASY